MLIDQNLKDRVVAHARSLIAQGVPDYQRQTARATGVHRSSVQRWLEIADNPQANQARTKTEATSVYTVNTDEANETDEQVLGPDSWTINLKTRTVQTYEELVARCKVDLTTWDPEAFRVRSYQAIYTPRATRDSDQEGWVRPKDEGHARTVQMYAISATFKRKSALVSARTEIESLILDAKTQVVRTPLVLVKPPTRGYMLEVSVPDLHAGQLSWGRETGHDDYDLDRAITAFEEAVETLLARSAHLKYEKVLFVAGHDLLNADGDAGTTTAGTRQDNDSRHFKVYQAVRRSHTATIERFLKDVAPVDVVVMPGNHDRLSTMHLGDSLSCWFHSQKAVTVDAEPTSRKYHRFGQVLLGITHGDRGKPLQWSRLMPVEARDAWGQTRHREVHCGHMHTDSAVKDELNGVKVRLLPSLAPPSAWAAGEGLVGQSRCAEAFHWHADEGLVGTAVYTVA